MYNEICKKALRVGGSSTEALLISILWDPTHVTWNLFISIIIIIIKLSMCQIVVKPFDLCKNLRVLRQIWPNQWNPNGAMFCQISSLSLTFHWICTKNMGQLFFLQTDLMGSAPTMSMPALVLIHNLCFAAFWVISFENSKKGKIAANLLWQKGHNI